VRRWRPPGPFGHSTGHQPFAAGGTTVDEASSPAAANSADVATKTAKATQDSADELKAMRQLLQQILEASERGTGEVVEAVSEGTAATRGLDQRVASGALDAMVKARR
jgi:hypothetical protein